MPLESLVFSIRDFDAAADTGFVYDSYLRTMAATLRPSNRSRFFKAWRAKLDMLLGRGRCRLAVWPDAPTDLIGWALTEPQAQGLALTHFVYVKAPYRNAGVARGLLGEGIVLATHYSLAMMRLALSHADAIKYVGTDVPDALEEFYVLRNEESRRIGGGASGADRGEGASDPR